ncbi:MAG: acyl-CoA thioesterase [Nitrospirae bacterium]|nr:acyl-CoA thioesterase [Nitrospirota bacterium]MBI3604455.1 acyl-CoA thioesterase [Nitrospirota bacterium]
MEISVYYEDTDCGGVVYYANYLKYFERGRTELLEAARFSLSDLMGEGIVFTVVQCEIFYRSPARYRDILRIETWLTEATRTVLNFSYRIIEKKSGKRIVEGNTKLVSVGLNGKVRRLPQEMADRLATIVTPPRA